MILVSEGHDSRISLAGVVEQEYLANGVAGIIVCTDLSPGYV